MKLALTNCRLIDGIAETSLSDATVVVDGQHIAQVGPGGDVQVPPDAQVIDLGGRTLMPGLIDAHVHLTWYYYRPDVTVAGMPTYTETRIAMVGVYFNLFPQYFIAILRMIPRFQQIIIGQMPDKISHPFVQRFY